MDNKKIGYIRVSSISQNTVRQEILMKQLDVDAIYIEKISGKNVTDRPQLNAMIDMVQAGDTVVVESISRFARNTKDLLELIEVLHSKNVAFISQKEAIDTTTPTGLFMLTIFGAVAALEREYIKDRQREGIAIAKVQGKYKGRKRIEHRNFESIYKKWQNKDISATEAIKILGISSSTFYRRVKEHNINIKNNHSI